MTTEYHAHPPISNLDRPAYQADTRDFCVVRHTRNGLKVRWEAYIRAPFVADWFFHAKGSKRALMAHINMSCNGDRLPLGEPSWLMHKVIPAYTNLPGDVIAIIATWPNESELAL